jgi:DNA replication protein DnaC
METELLLREYCTQLHLSTVGANYRRFAEDAARDNQPYDRFLLALLEREIQQRAVNQEQRRLRDAGFPVRYALDTFDFTALPQLNKARILELAQGRWIAEHQNTLLVGDIGTGKTHVGTALAAAACHLVPALSARAAPSAFSPPPAWSTRSCRPRTRAR